VPKKEREAKKEGGTQPREDKRFSKKTVTATSIVEAPTLKTLLVTENHFPVPTWSHQLLLMRIRLPRVAGSKFTNPEVRNL
jgi:hypothetical protein